ISAVDGFPLATGLAPAAEAVGLAAFDPGAAPVTGSPGPFFTRAAARISAVLCFSGGAAVAGFGAGFGGALSLGVAADLAGASFFVSAAFGSGFGTTFKKSSSISYQPMLSNWSNSTNARPFMLTVLTKPVALRNRANSGREASTTTYLSV